MKKGNKTRIGLLVLLLAVLFPSYTSRLYAEGDTKSVKNAVALQTSTIKGKIVDENGEPMIGVGIMVKEDPMIGTTTDMEGLFKLNAPKGSTLLIRFIGYKQQEIVVGDQNDLKIVMKEEAQNLDEVVVIGYGKSSKRKMTAAVSSVDTKKLENLPVSNITDAMAGRTPGLIVTRSGGGIGKTSAISIRGGGTPIVVIDGVVRDYSDFENILSDDIESLNILKDASAAAVYGARAGDGVLVVVTKSGSRGFKVNYSFSYNLSQPTIMKKKLGSYERALIDNEALYYEGRGEYAKWTLEQLNKYRDGSDPFNYPNTDWQELCLHDFAPEQRHTLSLQGGSELLKYYASLNYYNQESLLKTNSDWMKRYNYRLSVTADVKEIGLKVTTAIDGWISKTRQPYNGYYSIYSHIQDKDPFELGLNEYGLYYAGTVDNPLVDMDKRSGYNKRNGNMFNGQIAAELKVPGVEGLTLKANGSYRYYNGDSKSWKDKAPVYDLGSTVPQNYTNQSLSLYSGNDYLLTTSVFADYERTFAEKHTVSATFGYEQSYGFAKSYSLSRKDYSLPVDQIRPGPVASAENDAYESEEGRAGVVGRLKYDYASKYIVEGSIRFDGSDLFPKDKRWGTFLAGSAAWIISEEHFFQILKDKNILNFLKLRGSYGEVGLDNGVGRFAYIPKYELNDKQYLVDGKFVPGFYEGGLVSPDITWYTSDMMNLGVDFNTLGGRLAGTFEYFYMKTTGYLTSPSGVDYTDPLGIALPKVKSDGEKRRAGYEVSLSWKDKIAGFEYEVGGSFTYFDEMWARNLNDDMATLKNPYKRTTQETGYWGIGYVSDGFYKDAEDIANSPKRTNSVNLAPGDIKYKDINGDGVIDANDQVRIGKNGFPRGNYGIYANLKYKGIFMNVLFQGATSRDIYLGNSLQGHVANELSVAYPFQKDYWTPTHTNARFPRLQSNVNSNGNNNFVTSDFWFVNGKYLRLKSLQIGYDFKNVLLKEVPWVKTASIVLSGQNLCFWSPAKKYGLDPEVAGTSGRGYNVSTNAYDYPLERIYSVSLNIGF